ncbi:MAG: hypothetical protein HUU26_05020 [Gemmatimonadaceae bacterium]|nr:hypothetical protein [Gemmatimonadaceae bacterium]
MDENLARVILVGVIGITVTVSVVVMSIAGVLTARRRRDVVSENADRIEERLIRMEQAIDAIATEVERVAEGQRFTTRLLAERQAERQTSVERT